MVRSGMLNRFYVYELSDPRTGAVFYVGKGCGNRATRHLADARNGRIGNARKHSVIAEILDEGLEPTVTIVADNLSEGDAFSIERDRIRFHGYISLTNIQPGTLTAMERSKLEAQISLNRLKPHDAWLSERPRSEFEIDLALRVRAELAHIAQHGQVTEIIVSRHGVELR
jgi:hypothetical protein